MKNWMRFLMCMIVALTLVACGSDDEEGDGDGTDGTTDAATDGDTADGDGDATDGDGDATDGTGDATDGADGDATDGADGDATDGEGFCTNADDMAYLESTVDGGTGRDAAAGAASDCGLGCLSDPDAGTCAAECMLAEPHNIGLTQDCAGCYGEIVVCTIANCSEECIADSSAQICTDCQVEFGCVEEFNTCTGLE